MENTKRYIGVFDSGIGGLTVVKSIVETMPDENILYFGDTAHVPYGTRSREQITEYVLNDVRFLSRFDLKAIVIACNTADAIAKDKVKELYPMPVFGVVDPASRKAADSTKNGKIGVIATNATVNSRAYNKEIAKYNADAEVLSVACPLLVPLVENGRFRKDDIVINTVLHEYLAPLREAGVDTLVLGCTHYPLLYDVISSMMPDVNIISSSVAAAEALRNGLEELGIFGEGACGERKYYVSDNAEYFEKTALVFMGDNLGGSVSHVEID